MDSAGEHLYKRYLHYLRVDGGSFAMLPSWQQFAWAQMAVELDEKKGRCAPTSSAGVQVMPKVR